MLAAMATRLWHFLRGVGSVLVIAPAAHETAAPLYRPQPSVEDALRAHWQAVGDNLRGAMAECERDEAPPTSRLR